MTITSADIEAARAVISGKCPLNTMAQHYTVREIVVTAIIMLHASEVRDFSRAHLYGVLGEMLKLFDIAAGTEERTDGYWWARRDLLVRTSRSLGLHAKLDRVGNAGMLAPQSLIEAFLSESEVAEKAALLAAPILGQRLLEIREEKLHVAERAVWRKKSQRLAQRWGLEHAYWSSPANAKAFVSELQSLADSTLAKTAHRGVFW